MSVRACVAVWSCATLLAGCDGAPRAPLVIPVLTFEAAEHFPDRALPRGLGAGEAFLVVTNNLDDTVSFLDLARLGMSDFAEVARVPVGLLPVEIEGPHHAAFPADGRAYFVAISNYVPGTGSGPHGAHGTGTGDGYLLKYDTADHRLLASTRVDRSPGDVVLSPDGETVYLTHFDLLRITDAAAAGAPSSAMDARLVAVDARTMARKAAVPLCPAPHGMRFSRDGQTLYAACLSDELAIVDLRDPALPVRRLPVASNAGDATNPRHQPYAMALSPATGEVFVSGLTSGEVLVYDPARDAMVPERRIRTGGSPVFGEFSADGARLYLPVQGVDQLMVINAPASEIVAAHNVRDQGCRAPHQTLLFEDRGLLLLLCEGDKRSPGALLTFALSDLTRALSRVELGIFPDFMGVLRRPR